MTETTRIRWEPTTHGGFTGHVGTLEPWAFQIFKTGLGYVGWSLNAQLPGSLGEGCQSDDPDELKAKAERWLEEFVFLLGAVFAGNHDLPPRDAHGMRNLTCGVCGETFGTNFRTEEIECAVCQARRCPCCGEWFGGDD